MGIPLRTELPRPGRVEGGWTVPAGGGGRPPCLPPPHRTSLSCVECARGDEFPRSRPPGPSSPDWEVCSPPSSFSRGWGAPPTPGTRKPLSNTPEGLEADEPTHSISVSGGTPLPLHPPLAGSFVPLAAGVSSRLLGERLSWRPRGSGSPQHFFFFFFFVSGVEGGRGNVDTYRTPRRGKARPAQTSTAETLLCSSDGP